MIGTQARRSNPVQRTGDRSTMVWPRGGAACGLAFVLLQSAALGCMASGGWLDPGAAQASIAKAFAGTPPSQLWLGGYLSVLAALCFIPFAARVAAPLRDADAAPGWLRAAALGGAWALVASELAGAAALDALLARAGNGLSPVEAVTLFDLAQALLFMFWAGGTVFLAASAVLALRLRALPRWLGVAAAAIAAAFLVAAPASPQLLHAPATLFYLWVIAASIALMRLPQDPQAS